jgi:hypothetical protein
LKKGERSLKIPLSYRGPLLATNDKDKRLKHKQDIRRQIHPQLAQLWKSRPTSLHSLTDTNYDRKIIGKFQFIPTIGGYAQHQCVCELDLQIFSRQGFGSVIQRTDLDNRLKTLFDALRHPDVEDELPKGDEPKEDETPFYVLLKTDALIQNLTVKTQRLLRPPATGDNESDIELQISLDVRIADAL